MGGVESGSWYRWDRKSTVEESLVVSMRDLRKQLFQDAGGTLTWTWASGHTCSAGYLITWDDRDDL